jgi:hypothetical protein
MQKYELDVSNLNFKMKVEKINLATKSKELAMENIFMTQMHSHGSTQRFYFINQIHKVHASGINFNLLVDDKKVMMDQLNFQNMDLKIFLDGSKPEKQKKHSTPQDYMSKIKFPLDIKNITFNNANILYENQEPGFKETDLTFTRSTMVMENLNNDPQKMTRKTPATIKGTTWVLGQGLIIFNISIPFLSKTFDCSYDGTVGKMDGTLFNDFMASSGLKVERGQIEPSHFQVNIVNGNANGNIEFIYHDLKVRAIDPVKGELKKKKTWLANFAIKDNNPQKKDHDPEIVNIQTDINYDDSFFSFLWKVVRIGAVETMTKSHVYQQKE